MRTKHQLSERKSCQLVGLHRSVERHASKKADQSVLKAKICAIARARPRFGYRRIHLLLRKQGLRVNHKRVYRLYKACSLKVM